MIEALLAPLGREALARSTLLINHVLAAEPEATRRLRTQTGRGIAVEWSRWPALLPKPPRAAWTITPAGMLDLDEDEQALANPGTLEVTLDATEMARWVLSGAAGRPPLDIRGDAALAAEVSWLAENLRWDLEDDLARVIGDAPAHQLARLGQGLVGALRGLLQRKRPDASA